MQVNGWWLPCVCNSSFSLHTSCNYNFIATIILTKTQAGDINSLNLLVYQYSFSLFSDGGVEFILLDVSGDRGGQCHHPILYRE